MSFNNVVPGHLVHKLKLEDFGPVTVPDPREAKLPKWAQAELADVRRKLRDAESRIRELRHDIPDSDTFVDTMRGTREEDIPLPRGARVRFMIGDGRFGNAVRAYVSRDQWGGVRLYVQGDRTLTLHPSASNTFYVQLAD